MKSILAAFILISTILICSLGAFADSITAAQSQKSRLNSKTLKQLQRQSLGGVSDGGSSGLYVGNHLVLLDLHIVDTRLFNQQPGSKLLVTDNSLVSVKDQPAFQDAMRLLKSSDLPKSVQSVVTQALTNMQFRAIKQDMPVKRAAIPKWLSARSSSDRLVTIAMYSEEHGGATISEPYWNKLGNLSQAGVLIHEALRHIQFVDEESKSDRHLSDEVLQDLTAQIIAKAPTTMKASAMGWFLEEAILADVKINQEKVSAICKEIENQFPSVTPLLTSYCDSPLQPEELGHLEDLSQFSIIMTELLPGYLMTEQGKDFIRVRDEVSVIYLNYLLQSIRKSNFGFIRLKYQMDATSFLD